MFTETMVGEIFASKEVDVEYIEFDSNITCSYCRANIFNRFLTCKHCVRQLLDGTDDTYDVCSWSVTLWGGRACASRALAGASSGIGQILSTATKHGGQ